MTWDVFLRNRSCAGPDSRGSHGSGLCRRLGHTPFGASQRGVAFFSASNTYLGLV